MRYLIDTNICVYIMNRRPAEVIKKFKQISPGDIGISSVTVSELQYGVSKSKYKERNQQRLDEFLLPMTILAFDANAAKFYGDIRYDLEKQGQIIGPLDLLIAAHAMSEGLIIVTNNDKEFRRIKGLTVENWAKMHL
jgi:tRNA(fMet)-specific endonuclease VapC